MRLLGCVTNMLLWGVLITGSDLSLAQQVIPLPPTQDCSKLADQFATATGACGAAKNAAAQADTAANRLSIAAGRVDLDATALREQAEEIKKGLDTLKEKRSMLSGQRLGVAKPEPLGDFVPCLLDGDQQWAMRGMRNPYDGKLGDKPASAAVAQNLSVAVPNAIAEVSPDIAKKLREDPRGAEDQALIVEGTFSTGRR